MARPIKDGVDYWPFDVRFFTDKKIKLIKAEFGIKGVMITLMILNSVYGENGYFKTWDKDDCFLTSEGVGDGCSPQLVGEVLRGCFRRSLFNEGTFKAFGILTSAGIQRRYLNMISKNRPVVKIYQEYWLLNKNELPAGIRDKVIFESVNIPENPDKSTENPFKSTDNPDKSTENPTNKTKQNDTIQNNKEKTEKREIAARPSPAPVPKHMYGEYKNVFLTDLEYQKLHSDYPNADEAISFFSEYLKIKDYKAKSHYLAIRKWVFKALKEEDIRTKEIEQREERINRNQRPSQPRNNDLDDLF